MPSLPAAGPPTPPSTRTRRRTSHDGRTAKTTISLSLELLERLDRYHKQLSAGRWRRGEAPTKSEIIAEAITAYLDAAERRR